MYIYPRNEMYEKLDDDRDTIDSSLFIFSKIDSLHYAHNFDTMIVTFQKKDDGLDHDTDDDEYQTSRFHRSRILNYHSSVIKKPILRSILRKAQSPTTTSTLMT